jgi:hypothetical protein
MAPAETVGAYTRSIPMHIRIGRRRISVEEMA